jgi:hypothetical protein
MALHGDERASARLCRQVLICQGLRDDGQLDAVIEALQDESAWAQASPELLAYRALSLAEVHFQTRDFDNARQAWRVAEQHIALHEVAATYVGGAIRLLEHRMAYSQAPTRNYGNIAAALASIVSQGPGTCHPEVDRFTRGMALNLAALCERRWLEEHACHSQEAERRLHCDAALRYWFAALFGFLTTGQHEHVQHMCANVGYLLQRLYEQESGIQPEQALEWYGLAQAWQNRFELPDNTVWEYIFLGDFWLYRPAVRPVFNNMALRIGWNGKRPDTLEFYEHAAARALEIGEPRQMAHTSLNLFHFAREHHFAAIAEDARLTLRGVLDSHPDVRSLLAAEGYSLT